MSLIERFFGKKPEATASVAKERLQLIIAHENQSGERPDFLPDLKRELMAVLAKYLDMSAVSTEVNFEKNASADLLKIDVVMNGDKPETKV